jgi:hypothetical protein
MALLPPIRGPIKYLAELFKIEEFDPRLAIADSVFDRSYNIYAFSIAPHITDPTNYWIAWGGWFDNPVGYGLSVFMNLFLTEQFSTDLLQSTENSFYIDRTNNILYINIPLKPWEYFDAFSALYNSSGTAFTTAPKDSNNLSDIYYEAVKVYPRMKVPTLNNKLNDVISGIVVYNDFTITIDNSDGMFNDAVIIDFFNTPIQIGKTDADVSSVEDFNRIRFGLVDDIAIAFDQMQVKGVDKFYRMSSDYCRKFTKDEYPNLDDGDVNEDIPVAWGSVLGVSLVEVNKDTGSPPEWIDYIAIDPNYITDATALYDGDGNSLTFTFYPATGIIRATELDGDGEVIEAESADVTGKADSRIGQIIIDALSENENIPYVVGVWDVTETNLYLALCASVGFYFDGGTTKDLMEAVLKNDNAFLIQKNNGLLTIRQWGQEYDTHEIYSWLTTEKPKKNFKDASKYFCSSVEIKSHKNHSSSNYTQTYIDDTREAEIFENYRRSFLASFETDLLSDDDISDLASRLLQRFGVVRETLQVGFAVDTYQINLLDKIIYSAEINDRLFSGYEEWIVKECDPAQDTIILEGFGNIWLMSFDGDYATLDDDLWEVTDVN